jgi:hypothetical protein
MRILLDRRRLNRAENRVWSGICRGAAVHQRLWRTFCCLDPPNRAEPGKGAAVECLILLSPPAPAIPRAAGQPMPSGPYSLGRASRQRSHPAGELPRPRSRGPPETRPLLAGTAGRWRPRNKHPLLVCLNQHDSTLLGHLGLPLPFRT